MRTRRWGGSISRTYGLQRPVLDGKHDAVYNVLPQVFDFFARHARDDGRSNAR